MMADDGPFFFPPWFSVHSLPGVGQHLQDHLSAQVEFKLTSDAANKLHSSGSNPVRTFEFLYIMPFT